MGFVTGDNGKKKGRENVMGNGILKNLTNCGGKMEGHNRYYRAEFDAKANYRDPNTRQEVRDPTTGQQLQGDWKFVKEVVALDKENHIDDRFQAYDADGNKDIRRLWLERYAMSKC